MKYVFMVFFFGACIYLTFALINNLQFNQNYDNKPAIENQNLNSNTANSKNLNHIDLFNLGLQEKKLSYRYVKSFNSIPDQLNNVIIIPDKEGKKLKVKAGSKVALFAPKGEFIVIHYADSNEIIYPQKASSYLGSQPIFNLTTISKDAYLYGGYFYPDKNTIDNIDPGIFEFLVYVDDTDAKSSGNEMLSSNLENTGIRGVKPVIKYVFHGIGIIAIIVWCWFVKEHIKDGRQEAAKMGKSEKFISLREAYKKNPNNPLLCVNCGNPLQTVDLYNCPAGHVPAQPQSIFKKCGVDGCPYEFSNITCNHCGNIIPLNKDIYNMEEIQNRGKQKILRVHPIKNNLVTVICSINSISFIVMYLIADFFLSAGKNITKEATMHNYQDIHGVLAYYNNINPLPYYGFALIVLSVVTYIAIMKMDNILVGNPYEQ